MIQLVVASCLGGAGAGFCAACAYLIGYRRGFNKGTHVLLRGIAGTKVFPKMTKVVIWHAKKGPRVFISCKGWTKFSEWRDVIIPGETCVAKQFCEHPTPLCPACQAFADTNFTSREVADVPSEAIYATDARFN